MPRGIFVVLRGILVVLVGVDWYFVLLWYFLVVRGNLWYRAVLRDIVWYYLLFCGILSQCVALWVLFGIVCDLAVFCGNVTYWLVLLGILWQCVVLPGIV